MKQDYLSISVQDNGQGIPADQLDTIGYTTVTSTTGTGNALVNLNKRLTGLFGTTSALNIQSSQSGTTVSCLIPYKSSKEEHFMKALIVDDEPLARNELQYLLNLNDAIDEIEEAENIEETLEKLLYNTFDLIFLDINLMDESGIDLAQKLIK